jgi:hypothetical chaperone protein
VQFLFEPEAAARTAGAIPAGGYGLVVDIGGGTSDFSIFAQEGGKTRIIASHGVRIGGTDFDRALSLTQVMPLMGRGHLIRNELGAGTNTAPNAIFNDLATWEKIAFLYTPENRRLAARFAKLGQPREPFARLQNVLDMELGHDIAFAVEAGKIAANADDGRAAAIALGVVERGLTAPLTGDDLGAVLGTFTDDISAAATETLSQAQISADQIGVVVFVGGSSLMQTMVAAMASLFPAARQERTAAFTAVADGLAMAAADL